MRYDWTVCWQETADEGDNDEDKDDSARSNCCLCVTHKRVSRTPVPAPVSAPASVCASLAAAAERAARATTLRDEVSPASRLLLLLLLRCVGSEGGELAHSTLAREETHTHTHRDRERQQHSY